MNSFGSCIDPAQDEELKSTKIEIDDKVAKITKLIKNRNKGKKVGSSRTDSEVVEFIQDFHKQYQSLYVLYDNLVGEVKEKVNSRDEKEASDSESYHSLDESGSRTGESKPERRRVTDGFNQKLETSNVEVADLRNKGASISVEKEDLGLEHMASLSKIQELEKIIEGLRVEAEQTKIVQEKLSDESGKLKKKLIEREKELLSPTKTHQVQESESSAPIKKLESQVTSLKLELETLHIQKRELREQNERLTTEAKREGEEYLELEARILEHEKKMLEEKEGLKVQVKDLELKADTLRSQKNQLEEHIRGKDNEVDQLRVEKERSSSRILEMEKSLIERSDELSAIQTKLENLENDPSNQIKSLGAHVNNLQQELESLQTLKSQLELQIEREKKESPVSLTQMEKQNTELTGKIADQQRTLKEQEDLINKLNEENKQIKGKLKESKLNFQVTERKIEEMAEVFRKKCEDNLRILSRRIRVSEQLHVENKECYSKMKERCEKEHVNLTQLYVKEAEILGLREKVWKLENEVRELEKTVKEREEGMLVVEKVVTNEEVAELDVKEAEILGLREVVWKLENEVRELEKMVKESEEGMLVVEKVATNEEVAELDVKEAEILGLREVVCKLENEVRELEKMVKERDEGMLVMGEEKREAIRQLCVSMDYHRDRSDYLYKMLKMSVRSQRTP